MFWINFQRICVTFHALHIALFTAELVSQQNTHPFKAIVIVQFVMPLSTSCCGPDNEDDIHSAERGDTFQYMNNLAHVGVECILPTYNSWNLSVGGSMMMMMVVVEIIKGKWKSHSVAGILLLNFIQTYFRVSLFPELRHFFYSVPCFKWCDRIYSFWFIGVRRRAVNSNSFPLLFRIPHLQYATNPKTQTSAFVRACLIYFSAGGVSCRWLLSFKCRFFIYEHPRT